MTTEDDTIAAVCTWLRSSDQNGHAHTHTLAKELERGDWQEFRRAPAPTSPRQWYENHSELCAFARACMHDELTAADVLQLFEQPWKFTPEHDAWVSFDRPAAFDSSSMRPVGLVHEVEEGP